jgi:hypothetical protein
MDCGEGGGAEGDLPSRDMTLAASCEGDWDSEEDVSAGEGDLPSRNRILAASCEGDWCLEEDAPACEAWTLPAQVCCIVLRLSSNRSGAFAFQSF